MKKILYLFTILFGVLCLSGCGISGNNPFSGLINNVLGDAFSGDSREKADSHEITENESAEVATEESIEEIIDRFIASRANSSDVAVTVIDNTDGNIYNSGAVNSRFTAWGFYLPIYLSVSDQYPAADRANIMSSDPATCNSAANSAIDRMGGLTKVSDYLSDRYGAKVTDYGRLFGAPSANGDNYTCSVEAAVFLKELNRRGEFDKLSYRPENFGIMPSQDMTLYAQIGTENNSVRDNLNLFGIVKGNTSDYCIVVLTQNGSSANNFITDLLSVIHDEMESR